MHIDERLPELALILLAIFLPSTVVLKAPAGNQHGSCCFDRHAAPRGRAAHIPHALPERHAAQSRVSTVSVSCYVVFRCSPLRTRARSAPQWKIVSRCLRAPEHRRALGPEGRDQPEAHLALAHILERVFERIRKQEQTRINTTRALNDTRTLLPANLIATWK